MISISDLRTVPAGQQLADRHLRRHGEDVAVGRVGIQLFRPEVALQPFTELGPGGLLHVNVEEPAPLHTANGISCPVLNDRSRRRASAARAADRVGRTPRGACGSGRSPTATCRTPTAARPGSADWTAIGAPDPERLTSGEPPRACPTRSRHAGAGVGAVGLLEREAQGVGGPLDRSRGARAPECAPTAPRRGASPR